MCDYTPFISTEAISPTLHTSNPATIAQSTGGVGRNVATAAHFAGAQVALASVVADDIAGNSLVDQLIRTGLSAASVRQLKVADGARTAQYVAVNDVQKNLAVAMADMSIFARPELESAEHWKLAIAATKPKWLVLDGNWSAPIMSTIIDAAKTEKIPIAFEPVSTAKAARLFDKSNSSITGSVVLPNHVINLTTPNEMELSAMYDSVQKAGLFESQEWWQAIDSFGLPSSGSRDRLTATTNHELVNKGIPQQCIQLLPYIPSIITKLGPQGCLLTTVLQRGDERLRDPQCAPFVISRSGYENSTVGGIYMRLFPPSENVRQEDIVSVNGVGDTMLGVLIAGIVRSTKQAKTPKLEEIIPIAQKAAVLTLRSREAVAPEIRKIQELFA